MSNDRPPMPDQPTTKAIPKPDKVEILLAEMRSEMREGFGRLEASDTLVRSELGVLRGRVSIIEDRMTGIERRQDDGSLRVKGESKTNLEQDAAIGVLVADVRDLKETQAKQLSILTRLDAVAANPTVRRVAYVLGMAVLGYLASKGWLTR